MCLRVDLLFADGLEFEHEEGEQVDGKINLHHDLGHHQKLVQQVCSARLVTRMLGAAG